ncbi:MAG: response regulator [Bacteroidales bacterium]|jgi:CheY-like chemotaxis protein|nr:response regulator [Bacteroidales bacterium]
MAAVMLIDDHDDIREMIKTSLVRHRYTVIEASNGKEALARFKPMMIDLVVTDILMPEEDGLEVIMKLRQIKPGIKIIAISGGGKAGPVNYLNLAKVLGADLAMAKPFSINELINNIREMIG